MAISGRAQAAGPRSRSAPIGRGARRTIVQRTTGGGGHAIRRRSPILHSRRVASATARPGLTQEATAQLLGMPRLTYHRIETGARHIHFADLAAICAMFDCAPGELLQDSQLAAAFARAAGALLASAPG